MHPETDMTTIIDMLRSAAASISETANWLSQQFGDKPTVPTAPKPAMITAQADADGEDQDDYRYLVMPVRLPN